MAHGTKEVQLTRSPQTLQEHGTQTVCRILSTDKTAPLGEPQTEKTDYTGLDSHVGSEPVFPKYVLSQSKSY